MPLPWPEKPDTMPLPATAAYRREESNQFDFILRQYLKLITPRTEICSELVREQSIDRIHIKLINLKNNTPINPKRIDFSIFSSIFFWLPTS